MTCSVYTERLASLQHILENDCSIFKLAKQMDRRNQDVVGEKCIRNDAGELSLSDKDKMKAWVEHYSRLLNVEFDWPSDMSYLRLQWWKALPPPVTTDLVHKALKNKMWQSCRFFRHSS